MSASMCVCGASMAYEMCCGGYHKVGGLPALTAEKLMRSRYAAYVLGLEDYLLNTWHASTRPASLSDDAPVKWLGLSVKRAWDGGADEGFVEFVARYRAGGGAATRLHEVSRFVREDGRWLYVDGVFED
ncbi:MAG: YchJ family metal-binding protein [Formosimonas sp.]